MRLFATTALFLQLVLLSHCKAQQDDAAIKVVSEAVQESSEEIRDTHTTDTANYDQTTEATVEQHDTDDNAEEIIQPILVEESYDDNHPVAVDPMESQDTNEDITQNAQHEGEVAEAFSDFMSNTLSDELAVTLDNNEVNDKSSTTDETLQNEQLQSSKQEKAKTKYDPQGNQPKHGEHQEILYTHEQQQSLRQQEHQQEILHTQKQQQDLARQQQQQQQQQQNKVNAQQRILEDHHHLLTKQAKAATISTTPTPTSQPELTEEEKLAVEKQKKLDERYHVAMKKINSSNVRSSIIEGFQILREVASQGHADAHVEIAFGLLSGVYMPLDTVAAKTIFEKYAEKGNPKAQAGLAFLYATGIATNSSQAKTLVYLTFSALGDDPMGRMMLGYRYWAGVGVTKNCEAALTFYKKVADDIAAKVSLTGGSLNTRVRLLDEEENPGNTGRVDDDLVQYYQFLADKGDAPAQVTLGQLNYQGGRGFEQNRQRAFEYFERAAKSGNANAQGYLGKIYAEGSETVKQNNESAIRYFKLAADQGNPIGHAGLGLMYLHGKGVKVDYNKAFKHFQISSDQGWAEGQLHLGNMYFKAQGVSRDYKQASRLFNLAAQNGHLLALYYLAQMHATGTGVARSCRTAVELYKNVCERGRWASQLDTAYSQFKAGKINSALSLYLLLAELGYEVAQSNVAYILDQDLATLVNQTYSRALIHWDRAASQGYVVARIKLGDYHYYGKGTEVDYEVAANHYKEASDSSSNAQAYFNLGYMHEQGLGMKRDIHLAKRQYDMAAEASPEAIAPVTLALIKLGFLYAVEYIQNQQWWHTVSYQRITATLPDEWDLYLITILALMLGFVVAFRRQHR